MYSYIYVTYFVCEWLYFENCVSAWNIGARTNTESYKTQKTHRNNFLYTFHLFMMINTKACHQRRWIAHRKWETHYIKLTNRRTNTHTHTHIRHICISMFTHILRYINMNDIDQSGGMTSGNRFYDYRRFFNMKMHRTCSWAIYTNKLCRKEL